MVNLGHGARTRRVDCNFPCDFHLDWLITVYHNVLDMLDTSSSPNCLACIFILFNWRCSPMHGP